MAQDVDVIRVSLAAAVQFIVSLEVREDLAKTEMKAERPVDSSLCPSSPPRGFEENGQVLRQPQGVGRCSHGSGREARIRQHL